MPDQRSGTGLTHTAHAALGRLVREDAVGQLRRRERTMARLGSEDGELKLDWVDAVLRLLADPERLEEMGGSVLAVQVLRALGFCGCAVTIHTLDSTDPAAINALLRELAAAKGLALPALDAPGAPDRDEIVLCRALLGDALMIGVAIGMTSEEPISHLTWHTDLLRRAGIASPTRQLAMALPGSYLERYAREHAIPTLPLQLDGGDGTGGRMSAPPTRTFLLPVALDLAARRAPAGSLRAILARAWRAYDLGRATVAPGQHRYVRLAAALAGASRDGAYHLFLALPPALEPIRWWAEQLMEESLGEGRQGSNRLLSPADRAAPWAGEIRDASQRALAAHRATRSRATRRCNAHIRHHERLPDRRAAARRARPRRPARGHRRHVPGFATHYGALWIPA